MTLYAFCLVGGLLFTIMSVALGHFLGGHDTGVDASGHADGSLDSDASAPSLSFSSPTVLASFVTAFGAFGLVFSKIELTSSPWISAPLAAFGGLGIALVTLWFFNKLFQQTQSSSESHVASLTGVAATVITPIPENSVGEIAYVQAGSRYTAPARAEQNVAMAAGVSVIITHVVGTQFYVKPAQ